MVDCKCKFYRGFQRLLASTPEHDNHVLEFLADRAGLEVPVLSLEDLRQIGAREGVCPYYLSRYLVQQPHEASVVVLNYQYLLDPVVHAAALCPPAAGSDLSSAYFDYLVAEPSPAPPPPSAQHGVVVFDEAHNIDNVCNEALSRFLELSDLEDADKQLCLLKEALVRVEAAVPRALFRRHASVLLKLRVVLAHLKQQLTSFQVPSAEQPFVVHTLQSFVVALCRDLQADSPRDLAPLAGRYRALLRTAEEQLVPGSAAAREVAQLAGATTQGELSSSSFAALTTVVDFLALVAAFATEDWRYNAAFMLVVQQRKQSTRDVKSLEARDLQLELVCLDPSVVFGRMVVRRFDCCVLTSGTMSPQDMYARMLGFTPALQCSLGISFHRDAVLPLVVSSTVTAAKETFVLTSRMEDRSNDNILRGYGLLLIELSRSVPDGMVVFFPSYQYMERAVDFWARDNALGVGTTIDLLLQNKLLFFETAPTGDIDAVLETSFALHNFKVACDCGRGGILFAVARGKLSEGIDFSDHYGRCVVLVGMPFIFHRNPAVLGRMRFLREHKGIPETEYLQFDCMRVASQCVGRAIRNKADYAVLIFADRRYLQPTKFRKLPLWLRNMMVPHSSSSASSSSSSARPSDSTSVVAQQQVRSFFRRIAATPATGIGETMLTLDQLRARQAEMHHPII